MCVSRKFFSILLFFLLYIKNKFKFFIIPSFFQRHYIYEYYSASVLLFLPHMKWGFTQNLILIVILFNIIILLYSINNSLLINIHLQILILLYCFIFSVIKSYSVCCSKLQAYRFNLMCLDYHLTLL